MNDRTRHTLNIMSQRWMLHVLMILLKGPYTFSGLAKQLEGMSEKVLSKRLKELLREDVVTREVTPGRPIQVVYRLTSKGVALREIMSKLEAWSNHEDRW